MVLFLKIWQKILLKYGANSGSRHQSWWNLVEKVNAKEFDLVSPHHGVFGCGCFVTEDLNQELNVGCILKV